MSRRASCASGTRGRAASPERRGLGSCGARTAGCLSFATLGWLAAGLVWRPAATGCCWPSVYSWSAVRCLSLAGGTAHGEPVTASRSTAGGGLAASAEVAGEMPSAPASSAIAAPAATCALAPALASFPPELLLPPPVALIPRQWGAGHGMGLRTLPTAARVGLDDNPPRWNGAAIRCASPAEPLLGLSLGASRCSSAAHSAAGGEHDSASAWLLWLCCWLYCCCWHGGGCSSGGCCCAFCSVECCCSCCCAAPASAACSGCSCSPCGSSGACSWRSPCCACSCCCFNCRSAWAQSVD